MNHYEEIDESETCEGSFAGLSVLSPKSEFWLAEKMPAAELFGRLSAQRRMELVSYLRTGLVRAFATHAFVQLRFGQNESFKSTDEILKWIGKFRYYGGGERAFHGCYQVPQWFWHPEHSENSDWEGDLSFPFCEAYSSEWSIGKFGAIFDRLDVFDPGHEPPEKQAIGQVIYFAVTFQRADIEATFGQIENSSAGRSATYDWQAAYADVAASLYHDVEFENLEARGVQKKIIDMLRTSFEERGLPVPADDTLKPKAKQILGSLRSKKP